MNFPILSSLIILPSLGALFLLFLKNDISSNYRSSKYVSLFVTFSNFLISLYLWYLFDSSNPEFQFIEEKEWIKAFVNYSVSIDGI